MALERDAVELEKVAGISRRELLGGAVALTALGALGGCSASGDSSDSGEGSEETSALAPADQTIETDVVVLGSGMSGLSAAIEAAQKGASVVLLEKAAALGGNTNLAEGIFAVGSSVQKELGIELDVQDILADEYEFHNYNVNPKLWELVAHNSAENIDWLSGYGCTFETATAPADGVKTWHVFTGGHSSLAIEKLTPVAEDLGVQIMISTPGSSLLLNDGAVSGIRATADDGTLIDINAKAVVLATGGLAGSAEELASRTNLETGRYGYWGLTQQTGDGIRMAEEAGMGRATHITVCNLGLSVPGLDLKNAFAICHGMEPANVWVNETGERFMPESYAGRAPGTANAILNQVAVYSIMDQTTVERIIADGPVLGLGTYVRMAVPVPDLKETIAESLEINSENMWSADTMEGLAEAMGVNPETFVATMEKYNASCAAGYDSDYKKDPQYLQELTAGPFYAARVVAIMLNTLGGVRVNENMEVTTVDGTVIPGLYAAGMECTGFSGETYGLLLPGSTLGVALATGRVAGQSAGAYATA